VKKEDVDKMTLQEAMDYAIDKIVEQGGQCMIDDNCAYGNNKGQHCAVGWLLDEDNEELMSYKGGVQLLLYDDGDVPELIKIEHRAFEDFQNLHDAEYEGGESGRADFLNILRKEHGIDTTTNPSWGVWVGMGR